MTEANGNSVPRRYMHLGFMFQTVDGKAWLIVSLNVETRQYSD